MTIWSTEIKIIETLYTSLKGRFPDIEKELERLIKTDDENIVLIYARRCLEVIITDLCVYELKRPRRTEPLKGIIDKLNREEKVPSYIIVAMQSLNSMSTFGAHPKEFDPEQVKPVLNNLATIIKWYVKYKDKQIISKPEAEVVKDETKIPGDSAAQAQTPYKRLVLLLSGLALVVVIVIVALIVFNVMSGEKQIKELEKSIAVLPFDNMSVGEEFSYIGDAITDEIILELQKIQTFDRVLSRSSTMQYKENRPTTPEIAKKLGVNYLIEGSVQRHEEDVSIRVQVVRAAKEDHIWGDKYNGKWENIFSIQDEIAFKVANELKIVLSPEEIEKIEKEPTENTEAYSFYLKGKFWEYKMNKEGYLKAIENYNRAIELDPGFALAYTGLASSYLGLSSWHVAQPNKEYVREAENLLEKALKLDDNLAEVYYVLGSLNYVHKWNWYEAEINYKRGVELNPRSPLIGGYANLLTTLGRFEEAIKINRQNLENNPTDPIFYNELGFSLVLSGQYEEGLELYRKSLELDPDKDQTISLLISFYGNRGRYETALSYWEDLKKLYNDISEIPEMDLGQVGQIYGFLGRRDEALNLLNELNRRVKPGEYQPANAFAWIYIGLGDNEKAIEYLEQGYKEKDFAMVFLKVLYQYDPLRSDERFKELLRKMKLDE